MNNRCKQICLMILAILLYVAAAAQTRANQEAYVDNKGVLRWKKGKKEIQGFGINYTVPFAHAYRTAKKMGVNLEKAIDNDIYHFARLGFDSYRVHVWDTEISDTLGNLLNNEHLKLFDYMLSRMKERGMNMVITPIAYWGNGWPEPDDDTPGFARKYGKGDCLTNPDAIKAQENYLAQFLNHVNSYTGIAYKNDPNIMAFEVSNEPHHDESAEKVTTFISRMVKSMRSTGCSKPIFYNISHSIHLVDAYFNAPISGGTFQWYPSGLVARRELRGNFLPSADLYSIPFADNKKFKSAAKIVYEFDAADIGRSYMYPALARSFRKAGMQLAHHFAYDPTYMASINTEYGTHFMNLSYAPQKTLSLMIAGEVFHRVPLYKDYGSYPENKKFDTFRVSYEEDLAEMVTPAKFIYTNNTSTKPAENTLTTIAGYGSSPFVTYEGTGAYFLDKISSGVWRLEVMPDAIWIDDPFSRTSPKKQIAAVNWKMRPMEINLSDIGTDFSIKPLNTGNTNNSLVEGRKFEIYPGTYMVTRQGAKSNVDGNTKVGNISAGEFFAPPTDLKDVYLLHAPPPEVLESTSIKIKALIASPDNVLEAKLFVFAGFRPRTIKMELVGGYDYEAEIPADMVHAGTIRYNIAIKTQKGFHTFPGNIFGQPWDWDFIGSDPFTIRVLPKKSPLYLFNVSADADELIRPWVRTTSIVPMAEPGKSEFRINIEKISSLGPEDESGNRTPDYSVRFNFQKKIAGRRTELGDFGSIVLEARSLTNKNETVQVALITSDGLCFGGLVTIKPGLTEHHLPLSELTKVKLVLLPRPYPTFLPYFFQSSSNQALDMTKVESIQLSIGPGLNENQLDTPHGIGIVSVRLE